MDSTVITQCTLTQTADQISITVLDAIKWIDLSWKSVAENTFKNGFRVTGFTHSSSTSLSSLVDMNIIVEADIDLNNSDNPLQPLDTLLAHLHIDDSRLTAGKFVDIDSSVPTFNEWDNYENPKTYIQVTEGNKEEEETLVGQPPNVSQALQIMRKLRLFASIEQPILHHLIYDLESQLTDIYLESKAVKQSSITDYFSHC